MGQQVTKRFLGYKDVKVKSIVVGGDWDMAELLRSSSVRELAQSLEAHEQIHPVSLRLHGGKYELVAGGNRYAAHVLSKKPRIRAAVWEMTDREAREHHLVENLHRWHSHERRAQIQQELIDLYSEALPPEAPKEQVIEAVAQATGVQPESVERAQRRAAKREKDKAEAPAPKESPEEAFLTHGTMMQTKWLQLVYEYRGELDDADRKLKVLQRALNDCVRHGLAHPEVRTCVELVREVGVKLRGSRPKSLCPYCKGLDGVIDECAHCHKQGFVGEATWERAPAEVKRFDEKGVLYYRGRSYTLREWNASHAREPEPAGEVEPSGDLFGDLPP